MINDNNVLKFVKKYEKNIINEIRENGCIMGGNNGPYNDNETPLRNSSHWIIIFSWLYKKYNNKEYIKYIKILAEYVYDHCIYINKDIVTFCSRNKKGKDHINGTIGNAWIIEGLVEASKSLNNMKYYDLAVKTFLSFHFNEKIGIWDRYEIDGKVLGYDETFNHQLWLAASGSEIIKYKENEIIRYQLNIFLKKLNNNKIYRIHSNGLIKHFSYVDDTLRHRIGFVKNHLIKDYSKNYDLTYKEEGYHYFALYGLAILKENFPDNDIFKGSKIKRSVEYALDKANYIKQMNRKSEEDGTGLAMSLSPKANVNIYCFPYNSPAFELPYIIRCFTDEDIDKNSFDEIWNFQMRLINDYEEKNSNDINDLQTLIARVYELLRIL